MTEIKTIHELLGIEKQPRSEISESIVPFNSNSIVPSKEELDSEEIIKAEKHFEEDFLKSRETLMFVMDATKSRLEEISLIAKDKEGAKEYDSVNGLLRTLGDAAHDLLTLHEMKKKFRERRDKKEKTPINNVENQINNNAVFVGNSTDFKNFIKNEK